MNHLLRSYAPITEAGWKAIEEKPYTWRNEGDSNCCEREGSTDGFALPAKCRVQRIQEEAEGVRNDRSEAHHHACECGSHHAPSEVAKGAFVRCLVRGYFTHRPIVSSSQLLPIFRTHPEGEGNSCSRVQSLIL